MKLGATGPGKSQLSFAPLFMSIQAFSDQKTFREPAPFPGAPIGIRGEPFMLLAQAPKLGLTHAHSV